MENIFSVEEALPGHRLFMKKLWSSDYRVLGDDVLFLLQKQLFQIYFEI